MGGAGGEGLASARHGADGQHGGQNANIGETDHEEISKEMQEAGAEQGSETCSHVRAGQRVERGQLTAEVVDILSPTEVEIESYKDIDESIQKSQKPRAPHQSHAQLSVHHLAIEQRRADGNIAVVGHDSEQAGFSAPSGKHKEHLSHAALYWDGFCLWQEILQQLGHSDRGVAEIQKGQVSQEEVHGGVKTGISPDHQQ